ncbi:unnamed protein product [Urochloa decumbens]|uniref:Uncharacterized protein n=1 Tax=Urochloa decumbens TaxID=240449 RepID=A0ABC9AWN6_9POAL
MPKRVAVLLLVFAIIFSPKVAGKCTSDQKEVIAYNCALYIYRPRPGGAPETWSLCCKKVREVMQVTDMECIVQLLTPKEQAFYGKRFRDLELICSIRPTHPHS